MSKKNPGVIFDASNSWNGYNHQGKLAIFVAIKQILDVYDNSVSNNKNKENLSDYFVEIEYLEDFSLGKINDGKDEYYSVHQVKNHAINVAKNYNSALLGLAYHVQTRPELEKAYLHTTTDIDFKGDSVTGYVKKLISLPAELNDYLVRIDELRSDESKKQVLYAVKKGRPENFVVRLKQALFEVDSTQKGLDATNIDMALDALEQKVKTQIHAIGLLSDDQVDKIDLFSYEIDGQEQKYCKVDQIGGLIMDEIIRSIEILGLPPLWLTEKYIKNRYLYLLGKLDEHIIDRNLNYPLYMNNNFDRKIRLSQIFEWLTSDKFDIADVDFYQYQLKNIISQFADEFCKKCGSIKCDMCLMVPAINKIGQMTKQEMSEFLVLTCPSNNEKLSDKTFSEYLTKRRIKNPFFKGIKDISIPFEEDKQAITYIDSKTFQYILTTLENDDEEGINTGICTDILRNKELYELLRDYDCFISSNINVSSIQKEAQKLGISSNEDAELEEKRKEHIAHLKDVRIITLEEFKSLI